MGPHKFFVVRKLSLNIMSFTSSLEVKKKKNGVMNVPAILESVCNRRRMLHSSYLTADLPRVVQCQTQVIELAKKGGYPV